MENKKLKTRAEWYDLLIEPYRTKAINNTKQGLMKLECLSLKRALSGGFRWAESGEGYLYWRKVSDESSTITSKLYPEQPSTVIGWIMELDEPYLSQALENADFKMLEHEALTMLEALSGAFDWEDSPEGSDYWCDLAMGVSDDPLKELIDMFGIGDDDDSPEMKPIIEWLELVSEKDRILIIGETIKLRGAERLETETSREFAISSCFAFEESDYGVEFWYKMATKYNM